MLKIGLIGYPLKTSKSKLIFNYWANYHNLSLYYENYEADNFKATLKRLRDNDFKAVNVTLPYKKQAYLAADKHSKNVKKYKIANFLLLKNEKIKAYNFDIIALYKIFDNLKIKRQSATIFGAKGGAIAAFAALKKLKFANINFAIRKEEPEIEKSKEVKFININEKLDLSTQDLVINATSIGKNNENIWPFDHIYGDKTVYYDLNYDNSPFYNYFKAKNYDIIDGKEMLLLQAAEAFKKLFNYYPTMDIKLDQL